MAKNVSFFQISLKIFFRRKSTGQKFVDDHVSYLSIWTQLRACCLKILSHSDHICSNKGVKVPKNAQKCFITGYTNTFTPSRHSEIEFSFNHKKSNLSSLFFSTYLLKIFNRWFKKDQFCGFHDILAPMTLNLYIAFASNWNSN